MQSVTDVGRRTDVSSLNRPFAVVAHKFGPDVQMRAGLCMQGSREANDAIVAHGGGDQRLSVLGPAGGRSIYA